MKHKHIIIWTTLFAGISIFLQATSKFHFFYIEQLQLFQFTTSYITEKSTVPGGLSLLAGEFLTQFFITPYAGPLLVSSLLTIIGITTRSMIRHISPNKELYLAYSLPPLSLLLIQYDFNYLLQGTIAYLFILSCINGVIRIRAFRHRLYATLTIVPLLFWIGGAIAGLFVTCVLTAEICKQRQQGLLMTIALAEFLLIATGSVWMTIIAENRFAFLPDAYYHPILDTPFIIYLSWICLPLCIIAAYIFSRKKTTSKKSERTEAATQIILIIILAGYGISQYNDQKSYTLKTLDYYARTEQWDQIIQACQGPIHNFLYLGYLNRALAEKGELADKMFAFDQHGPQGLLPSWNKVFSVSTLLSDIYFTLGEIGLSQRMAFEAYVTAYGAGNPQNLKRLVQTNLIYGNYPVAEKYLKILENTYAYQDWAKAHRIFLYNDKAIKKDPLFGIKRDGLPKTNFLAGINKLETDLLIWAGQEPAAPFPLLFAGASFLLSKDLKSFQALMERFYGTSTLTSLPTSFQEAVILLAEQNPEYWKRFNLSESTLQRFISYRKLVLQNRNNAQLPLLIKQSFGDTYWSYYVLN